jgi:hypothetical protein
MKTIEITVTPTGQTKVETKGFDGNSCRQASEFLERALGQRMHEQVTSAFYVSQSETRRVQTTF